MFSGGFSARFQVEFQGAFQRTFRELFRELSSALSGRCSGVFRELFSALSGRVPGSFPARFQVEFQGAFQRAFRELSSVLSDRVSGSFPTCFQGGFQGAFPRAFREGSRELSSALSGRVSGSFPARFQVEFQGAFQRAFRVLSRGLSARSSGCFPECSGVGLSGREVFRTVWDSALCDAWQLVRATAGAGAASSRQEQAEGPACGPCSGIIRREIRAAVRSQNIVVNGYGGSSHYELLPDGRALHDSEIPVLNSHVNPRCHGGIYTRQTIGLEEYNSGRVFEFVQ